MQVLIARQMAWLGAQLLDGLGAEIRLKNYGRWCWAMNISMTHNGLQNVIRGAEMPSKKPL